MRETLTDRTGRPLKRVRLQKRVELRRLYAAHQPRWRHPLIGYLASVPIVALGVAASMLGRQILGANFFFPGIPPSISILIVALFWGVGPALLSVLLATIALDYFYIPPSFQFDLMTLKGVLQILPFLVSGLFIAIIVAQRESARMRALEAEEESNQRADELEQLNEELKQANSMKDQFLSIASHELKTPITTIRGQAQVALRRLSKLPQDRPEMETMTTTLQRIDAQTHRLSDLVDDLLALSGLRSGKLQLDMSDCDLAQVCREVIEDQRLLHNRPIELTTPPVPVIVCGDSNRLNQVVTNLVSNAIKYSPSESP